MTPVIPTRRCAACGASDSGCENLRTFAGRPCCERCDHDPEPDDGTTGGRVSHGQAFASPAISAPLGAQLARFLKTDTNPSRGRDA